MAIHIGRRELIVTLGGAAAAWPLTARAQQGDRVRRIGMIMAGGEHHPEATLRLSAFTRALADLGWADGRNVRMVVRWARGDTDRYRTFAQELVRLQSDIIVTAGTPATVAVQQETRTIPIVFANVGDPVASGIVTRLDRPGGNVTGFANVEAPLAGKWLELLSQVAPGLKRAAFMFNPHQASRIGLRASLVAAARSLELELFSAPVYNNVDIETAITALGRESGGGLVVSLDAFMAVHRAPVISAAARNNVPAIYAISGIVREGGLLSYANDSIDTLRRAASYVDHVLRGEKPGDLPVQFPTKFEMVVNLKTAKALGLAVPRSILLRADEVIE
jgi:ABC-type uncharacterized transport system substrate-binding protein